MGTSWNRTFLVRRTALLSLIVLAQPLFGQPQTTATSPPTDPWSTIVAQLGSDDLNVQGNAIEKLKGLSNKKPALPALNAFVAAHRDDASSDPDARNKREVHLMGVIQSLVSIGDPSSLVPLQEALARETNELSKVFLTWGTASLGDDSAREALLARLKDTGAPNRFATASALRAPSMLACKDLIDRKRLEPPVLIEIARQAVKDFDSARAWLKDLNVRSLSDYELRAAAKRAEETNRLTDAYREVWTAAFAVLAGTKSGVPVLITALHDPDPVLGDLRGHIAVALGESKDERAVPPLIDLLQTARNDKQGSAVADALKNITGQNFAQDAGKWSTWWQEEQAKKAPPKTEEAKKLPPKKVSPKKKN
jgi:hypothetical protein